MLVKYVRNTEKHKDGYHRVPVACIVVLENGQAGISVCNPKDSFNKKMARSIAQARAINGVNKLKPETIEDRVINSSFVKGNVFEMQEEKLYDAISREINWLQARAAKYYKKTGTGNGNTP